MRQLNNMKNVKLKFYTNSDGSHLLTFTLSLLTFQHEGK